MAWSYNNAKVYRLSTNGAITTGFTNQKWGRLENTGFDFTPNASGYPDTTWIYAEYVLDTYANYGSETQVRVWRSTDSGATWTNVFTKNTRNHASPEVYHFHFVKRDPYNAGHWYLGSGDSPQECFIWRSVDDGLTWTDISDQTYTGEKQKIHRTTNLYFTPDYIYWALDDYITTDGIGSAWVRSPRNLGGRLQITPLANLQNWCRNLTKTPYGLVVLTENRPTDTANGLIWLIPYNDLTKPILIGKTEGCSYEGQICDRSYGGRIFLARTPRTYPLVSYPSDPRFIVMTLNRHI